MAGFHALRALRLWVGFFLGRHAGLPLRRRSSGVRGMDEGRVGWAEGCREEGAVKSLRVLCASATSLLGGLATLREYPREVPRQARKERF